MKPDVSFEVRLLWPHPEPDRHGDSEDFFDPMVKNIKELFLEQMSKQVKDKKGKALPGSSLIYSLLYLKTNSRQDITSSVRILSRFVESPKAAHWGAAK